MGKEAQRSDKQSNQMLVQEGYEYLHLKYKQDLPSSSLTADEEFRIRYLSIQLGLEVTAWLESRHNKEISKDRPNTYATQGLDYDPLNDKLTREQEAREAARCLSAAREISHLHTSYSEILGFQELKKWHIEQSQDEVDEILAALQRIPVFDSGVTNTRRLFEDHGGFRISENANASFGYDEAELLGLLENFPYSESRSVSDQHKEGTNGILLPKIKITSSESVRVGTRTNDAPAKRGKTTTKQSINEITQGIARAHNNHHVMEGVDASSDVEISREEQGIGHDTVREGGCQTGEDKTVIASFMPTNVSHHLSGGDLMPKEVDQPISSEAEVKFNYGAQSIITPFSVKNGQRWKSSFVAAKEIASSTKVIGSGTNTKGTLVQDVVPLAVEARQNLQANRIKVPTTAKSSPKRSRALKSTHQKGPIFQHSTESGLQRSLQPVFGLASIDSSLETARHPDQLAWPHLLPPPSRGIPNSPNTNISSLGHQNQLPSLEPGIDSVPQMRTFGDFPRNAQQLHYPFLPNSTSLAGHVRERNSTQFNTPYRGHTPNHSVGLPITPVINPSTPLTNHRYSGSEGSSQQGSDRMQHFQNNLSPTPTRASGGTARGASRGITYNSASGKRNRSNNQPTASPRVNDFLPPFSIHAQHEICSVSFPNLGLRDEALAYVNDRIRGDPALASLAVVEPHLNNTTLRVSGPPGQNVRGKLQHLLPRSSLSISMA